MYKIYKWINKWIYGLSSLTTILLVKILML